MNGRKGIWQREANRNFSAEKKVTTESREYATEDHRKREDLENTDKRSGA